MIESIEKKLSLYMDISPELMELLEKDLMDAMWIFNVNTQKLEWINQSFISLIGFSSENNTCDELWQRSAKTGEHYAFLERVADYVESERESSLQLIMYHRSLSGKTLAYLYQANYYEAQNGEQRHLIGVCSDLNSPGNFFEDYIDRMKIQEFLFDNSKDAFYALDEEGFFLEIPGRKDHSYDLVPYSEVIGKNIQELLSPDIAVQVQAAIGRLKTTENDFEKVSYSIDYQSLGGGGWLPLLRNSHP